MFYEPGGVMKSILLSCLMFSLLVGPAVYAQGVGASGQVRGTVFDPVGASGQVRGTVFDPSGSVVPGASVEALDIHKGTRYSTTTDSSGQYQFPSLPPSTYELTSRHGGLQTEIQKGLEVQVGETSTVDFHMAIAGATVQVEVSAEPLAIETSRGSQANTVSQRYIEDLPISRRDYLT